MQEEEPRPRPRASRQTVWLSRGLEALVERHPDVAPEDADHGDPGPPRWAPADEEPKAHFDFVIVGSGYGGAVAAAELAHYVDRTGEPLSVCILERGSEYLRGSFPDHMAEVAGHVRFATPTNAQARGALDGLFDVRLGGDVNALVASGLGGGSLINAGVMAMPLATVFEEPRWPAAIRRDADAVLRLAEPLKRALGARPIGEGTGKYAALRALAPGDFRPAEVTVATTAGSNSANTELAACVGCGDCATGCNHNAKDSLDLNLLRLASKAGFAIHTGASVIRLERWSGGWTVVVNHTERHRRERQRLPFRIRARRVILAAGTFGSTEILMRSRRGDLRFSDRLGHGFSANADAIFVLADTAMEVEGVADENAPASDREVGPTITGIVDLRRGDPQTDVVIEDLGVPGSLRRLFEESVATADALNRLLVPGNELHSPTDRLADAAAVDPVATRRSLAVAVIGRDSADGRLEASAAALAGDGSDGVLTVSWPQLRDDDRFAACHDRLRELVSFSPLRRSDRPTRVIQNPVWRPLSSELERVFGAQRGPLVTVHPLGGCSMGDDARGGVVDDRGRVFDGADGSGTAVHAGLLVLDGSIVPVSLGINPSLTIAALTTRAIRAAIADWRSELGWQERGCPRPERQPRPVFTVDRHRRSTRQSEPVDTEIEITERLRGRVHLRGEPPFHPGHGVELTLTYARKRIEALLSPDGADRHLVVAKGKLRIVDLDGKQTQCRVSGRLNLLHHGWSIPYLRRIRALAVWLDHRGERDVVQNILERRRRRRGAAALLDQPEQGVVAYFAKLWRLFDHAGSVRLLDYVLRTESGTPVFARKRLRYAYGANPWRQLQVMAVHSFPDLERWWSIFSPSGLFLLAADPAGAFRRFFRRDELILDLDYLVDEGVPLVRVVRQQNRPAALVDLTRMALYLARVILQVHALTFRRPDPRTDREPSRLPGAIPGRLPTPDIEWRVVGRREDGSAVCSRLARYRDAVAVARHRSAHARPVLLIHGYSASGTTYAHPAVRGNVAETLCREGRDVWILDMRSSAGLPTATENWTFEDMAEQDIPDAIEHILGATEGHDGRIDVVAHCMGSAMFSMAVLTPTARNAAISRRIGRVVLSQVGPVIRLSTPNVFRAYVMRWAREFLPTQGYSFRPSDKQLGVGANFLDRVLATLNYPREEFALENPLYPPGSATPWATTRHRMDALYARTFSLANMTPEVLDRIDDFFGPLSIDTVSQVIHFARTRTVTRHDGFNAYVDPVNLQERFVFPVLYLHGRDNGLADVRTLDLMVEKLGEAAIPHLNGGARVANARDLRALIRDKADDLRRPGGSLLTWCIEGHGHQDSLIGRDAAETSGAIAAFLAA